MTPAFPVILFYKYLEIADPAGFAAAQRRLCAELGLKGRLLIATEGINGTLAGSAEAVEQYLARLRADDRFAGLEVKTSAGDALTFPRLVVKVRTEIVTLGAGIPLQPDGSNHLTPAEWKRALEEDPDAVLLDVRNRYESSAGHFARAILCDIENFRELPTYVEQLSELKNRRVLMYCTGGIRCEKASALFRSHGFTDVSQLHGGILAYQESFGNEHWLGDCFVFDRRMTVAVAGANPPIGQCAHTGRSTNRFVNCLHDPCHMLFLLAEQTENENPETKLCPACLADGWTTQTAAYRRDANDGPPLLTGK